MLKLKLTDLKHVLKRRYMLRHVVRELARICAKPSKILVGGQCAVNLIPRPSMPRFYLAAMEE